ncbi:MAG: hypothetical protein KBS79_01595 [Lachnospiraceae bacterium]|nr:hypothetical protein [Candidatus Minthocola equi]
MWFFKKNTTQEETESEEFNKYTYDPNKFKEDKTIFGYIDRMSYMKTAMILGGTALVLLILAIVLSIVTAGNVNISTAILGTISLLISLGGIWVVIYGHFIAQHESKIKWYIGLIPNAFVALFLIIICTLGLF